MSVYFITCREQGVCKIGRARNVQARLATLQTASASKLALEASLPGDSELERELHRRFAAHRLNGEWFAITEELDSLISEASANPEPATDERQIKSRPSVIDGESVERSIALHRRIFEEGMATLAPIALQVAEISPPPKRAYEPAPVSGGQFADHYAIRETSTRRLLCADLKLTRDQADKLCNVFESIRQRELA